MKYTTSMLCLLGLSVGKALAEGAVEDHHRGSSPAYWLMRRESDSSNAGATWRPIAPSGLYYSGSASLSNNNGRIVHGVPTRTAFPSQISLILGSLFPAPASSANDAATTEVITIPNGGENINGNGANGGSISVDHGQVFGTPGATETIISRRDIRRGNRRLVQENPASKDTHHHRHGGHHHSKPAKPTKSQAHTHVPLPATPSA